MPAGIGLMGPMGLIGLILSGNGVRCWRGLRCFDVAVVGVSAAE